jgi:RNA polymerase sigma-70 factor (ECF subfamily)
MSSHRQEGGAARDEEVFRAFYDTHFSAVYRYFGRRAGSVADVNDLMADVFLVAWRRFDEMPTSPHERTLWLYGVARRMLADRRKAERRRSRLVGRIMATSGRQVVAPSDFETNAHPDAARLSTALRQLSPRDRDVLALVAWEQLSHTEAAEVIGCTVNAFTIRFHRAKKRLAVRYEALAPSESRPEPRPPIRSQGAPDARP